MSPKPDSCSCGLEYPKQCLFCEEKKMPKLPIDGSVKVRIYNYLEEKIEDAIEYGYSRAHKHTDKPTGDQIKTEIESAIMNTLCDVFDFGDD